MSFRIEHADAPTLLSELPDRWAQSCIAHPPRTSSADRTLAILAEVRRVLRDDGTLWLLLHPGPLLEDLRDAGWRQQSTPRWATRLSVCGGGPAARPFLLTQERRYFYDADTIGAHPRSLFCVGASREVRRAQSCLSAREHEYRLQLVKRCILAGSSPLACDQCGAPYRRARPGERATSLRLPTCPHNNPDGRCLILDPFYRPGVPTAEAALCTGRSFLGIEDIAGASESR
jgi:hypothetical protein